MSDEPAYLEVLAAYVGERPSDGRTYVCRNLTIADLTTLAHDLATPETRSEDTFAAWSLVYGE